MSEPSLRSLPRVFVPGAQPNEPIDLPKDEQEKLHKVLRLPQGAHIAVLPGDGSLIRCEYRARQALPIHVEHPQTERPLRVTIAQAFPKGDRVETVIRMGTELGVAAFALFPADRSVVKWDESKALDRLRRYGAIAREAAEQSYRTRLPAVEIVAGLAEVLNRWPAAIVLSESENVSATLPTPSDEATIVVGPEGGWSPREIALIGDRAVTLGPLVLRTDTAGIAVAARLLLV